LTIRVEGSKLKVRKSPVSTRMMKEKSAISPRKKEWCTGKALRMNFLLKRSRSNRSSSHL